MVISVGFGRMIQSLPSRGRGLKYKAINKPAIEANVAPFTGAWIEMYKRSLSFVSIMSLPSRGRGLKFDMLANGLEDDCRSLHGGVD